MKTFTLLVEFTIDNVADEIDSSVLSGRIKHSLELDGYSGVEILKCSNVKEPNKP